MDRWHPDHEDYISALKDVDEDERTRCLGEMRSASYKRAFLISLKQRYPDGQGIALKLSKQLSSANKKLTKAIQAYNNIQSLWEPQSGQYPATVSFEVACDTSWDTYQTLHASMGEPGLPYSIKRKAIDAVSLKERAVEEQEMVKTEMERVMQHLHTQHGITLQEIHRCQESDNISGQAVLTQHIIRIELRMYRSFHRFKQHIPALPAPPSSHIQYILPSHMSDSDGSSYDDVSDDDYVLEVSSDEEEEDSNDDTNEVL
ncbi:uncharacterized protein LOC118408832 [Branchiostoma floridae]|uniref:Uncharacterized protein LOC118408832 n=1 Tax=Branchiostoma floridae TaxID=7739 RepID=A0A9J7KIX1_BRAFL|nr:uncharacterized protein LOC118408832 [Branchiostoma floridae]